MGVRGLQFYLENCCQTASPRIKIEYLAQEFRRHYHTENQELVVVVDGNSCLRHLYGDLEWIGGGQLKQFGEKAKYFVDQFASLGIRLVFFFDGPTIEEKRRTWVERRISKLDSMYYILDTLEKGIHSSSIDRKRHFVLPPGMGQLSRLIFDVLCRCEVHQSLAECDEEIADYARNNQVFAILAQDTDYVIYDKGQALYLSMESLDIDDMSTRLYDHQELARYLNIPTFQLPLLATLMGNDIINFQDLKPFHIRMMRHRFPSQRIDFKTLIPNLAMYIRSLPTNGASLFDMSSEFSQFMFGSPERARDVWTSLNSYYSSPPRDYKGEERGRQTHWNHLVAVARGLHQSNRLPSMVYAIMSGLPFESSTSIEDFRKDDLPSFASATQLIRRRAYGILMQEKPLKHGETEHWVPEWCMAGPHSLDEAKYVTAIFPNPRHPGLEALWSNNHNLDSVRWRLFVSSVSPNLDVNRVRHLPSYLVLPVLILFYINELNCVAEWEVDAMLATSVSLVYYSVEMLAALPSDPLTTRGIRMANFIMRSATVLYFLLAACGYPLTIRETAPWLFFDGKLFQLKYNQARNKCRHDQLCDHRVEALEHFQIARRVVFNL